MEYVLHIRVNDRKLFNSWMTNNVGTRGKKWAMDKPTRDDSYIVARIADKADAALVKIMYSDHVFEPILF